MPEKVLVIQTIDYATGFWAADPDAPAPAPLLPAMHIHELTPYGMLLASLGSCTAILLNSYAQNHGLHLHEVRLMLQYEPLPEQDRQGHYGEQVRMEVQFVGHLTQQEEEKLVAISRSCPVERMLVDGMVVQTERVEDALKGVVIEEQEEDADTPSVSA